MYIMRYASKNVGPQIVELLREGKSYAKIALAVDCSTATVAYHAAKHDLLRGGIKNNPNPRFDIDWKMIQRYYDEGHGVRDCCKHFEFSAGAWQTAVKYGDIIPRIKLRRKPLFEYLKENTILHSTTKKLLIAERGERCEECGTNKWLNKRLSLDIHHINENNQDNRSKNLRVLCPNCHRQQGPVV